MLYARLPGKPAGRVLSLIFRYFPHVAGNGRLTVRELIVRNECAQCKAALHLGGDPSPCGVDPLRISTGCRRAASSCASR